MRSDPKVSKEIGGDRVVPLREHCYRTYKRLSYTIKNSTGFPCDSLIGRPMLLMYSLL